MVRKFSDNLLLAEARRRDSSYRDRPDVAVSVGVGEVGVEPPRGVRPSGFSIYETLPLMVSSGAVDGAVRVMVLGAPMRWNGPEEAAEMAASILAWAQLQPDEVRGPVEAAVARLALPVVGELEAAAVIVAVEETPIEEEEDS